jgi:hypothetical protein
MVQFNYKSFIGQDRDISFNKYGHAILDNQIHVSLNSIIFGQSHFLTCSN